MRKRKSISELVQEYAERWRKDYTENENPNVSAQFSLRTLVYEHMNDNTFGVLDAFMGLERRYGEVRIVSQKDGEPPTIVHQLLEKIGKPLGKILEKLLLETPFELTTREKRHLQKEFRQALMCRLEEKIRELAHDRAEQIAEAEISGIWMDDEIVTYVTEKLKTGS